MRFGIVDIVTLPLVTVGPLKALIIFGSLIARSDSVFRRQVAIRTMFVAAIVTLLFVVAGEFLLQIFHPSDAVYLEGNGAGLPHRHRPEVAETVFDVGVIDNQRIKAGDMLFRNDARRHEAALREAEAAVDRVGQSIGANTAGVAAAEAALTDARAQYANAREQATRIFELIERGIYAKTRGDQMLRLFNGARAGVRQAEAQLEQARQQLDPEGGSNPKLRTRRWVSPYPERGQAGDANGAKLPFRGGSRHQRTDAHSSLNRTFLLGFRSGASQRGSSRTYSAPVRDL